MSESLRSLIQERVGALPEARRGYDRDAVNAFVSELLARGDDLEQLEAKPVSALSRRHVERMSEKMAELLDTAEENAADLLRDAEKDAAQITQEARSKAAEAASRAEAEARSAREAADRYAADTRREAEGEIAKL